MSQDKNIAFQAGLWYVVSSVMVKAVSLLTTPIFTRILSQTDYGITATFSSWYALLLTFCTLNLTYSIGRAKLDFPGKLEEYIGSMQLLSAVVTGGISLVLLVFLKPVSRFLELDPLLVVLLVVYLFFSPAIAFVQNGYRYRYQYKQNIAIAWYTALTTVAISLVLVLSVDNNKYIARVIGIVLPTVALSAVFWIRSLWKGQIRFRREYWKYGLALSGPLVVHTISMNILSQSDRLFISKICGPEVTGLYSLSANYGLLLSIVTNAVAEGWLPWFHDNYFARNFDAIRKNVKPVILLGCFIGLACIGFAPEAIRILGGEQYAEGIWCVPPIVLGIICQYIYTHYVNIEMHLKKTKYVSRGTVFAALLNIGLNAIFIPLFGYIAAAYTTFASYTALLFIHFFITRRILKVRLYQDSFLFLSLGVTTVVSGMLMFSYTMPLLRYLLIGIGFILFLFVFRNHLFQFFKKIKSREGNHGTYS